MRTKDETSTENNLFYYNLGKRDGFAEVLARNNGKIKLPTLAATYKKMTGEEHFSHKYHTEQTDVF